ncbi:MAG: YkgJ family cysteine cluster protein [Taibaiella sp.]|nr:YkgJ family cysteine cluster protein [Taibaiella sp.]
MQSTTYQTDLAIISLTAQKKQEENDRFASSLQHQDTLALDRLVHGINKTVSAAIDCTQCGNCCKTLIINVTRPEAAHLADHLGMPLADFNDKYIEESQQGNCFMNTMPCNFLSENKCTVYTNRFKECRDFPHLHKPGFRARFAGTLMHYGNCPIIYNVVEELKQQLAFSDAPSAPAI